MLEPDEQLRPYCRDTAAAMSVACCLARASQASMKIYARVALIGAPLGNGNKGAGFGPLALLLVE